MRICSAAAQCVDVPVPGPYSCAQQAGWGKCGEPWMQGFCQQTCNTCPAARSSTPLPSNAVSESPPAYTATTLPDTAVAHCGCRLRRCEYSWQPYSCAQQQGWGKCNASWMLSGNYCALTCGRCAPAPSPPPPPPPPPPPRPKPHPKPHAKPHPKPHPKPTARGKTSLSCRVVHALSVCNCAQLFLLCCSVRGCSAAAWPVLMRSTEGLGKVRRILDGWLLPRDMWNMQELYSTTGVGVCPDSNHPGGTNRR